MNGRSVGRLVGWGGVGWDRVGQIGITAGRRDEWGNS